MVGSTSIDWVSEMHDYTCEGVPVIIREIMGEDH